jgi:hypothetical protein
LSIDDETGGTARLRRIFSPFSFFVLRCSLYRRPLELPRVIQQPPLAPPLPLQPSQLSLLQPVHPLNTRSLHHGPYPTPRSTAYAGRLSSTRQRGPASDSEGEEDLGTCCSSFSGFSSLFFANHSLPSPQQFYTLFWWTAVGNVTNMCGIVLLSSSVSPTDPFLSLF